MSPYLTGIGGGVLAALLLLAGAWAWGRRHARA